MKHSNPPSEPQSSRTTSDNFCKLLAEKYPRQFARWAFGVTSRRVKVDKTELSREPIHADSVILASEAEKLHAEFQTTMKSEVPVPLRMLDYYVGLKRQDIGQRVRQVLIVLKDTGEPIPDRYEDERTLHHYDVILMWEQDPKKLLQFEELLPLATLCHTTSGEKLLREVAAGINRIESKERRRETLDFARVLAGLRYDTNLIYRILKEGSMLEESVIYQDILQKGEQRGERKVALLQLEERFGKLSPKIRKQIERLPAKQLEELIKALLYFKGSDELIAWLKRNNA
jgi:predicted transposase YdaD